MLGELNRSETIRMFLTLDVAPSGTPTITIEKNGASILAATAMTQGLSTLDWYYDYTTAADAVVGAYQVRYTAVLSGTTRYDYDEYNISVYNVDDIAALGDGVYNATINVKDDVPQNVADAYVSIHNSNDDDAIIASGRTDAQGNVTLNISGNIYVRVEKAGFNFTATAKNITASATYNVTGTRALSIQNPSDADLCRLFLFPLTLDGQDVTSLTITISSKEALTKVNGEFIKNASDTFTYDNTTDPDSYYFDAVQGSVVHVTADLLGIDNDVTVPAETTQNLYELIS